MILGVLFRETRAPLLLNLLKDNDIDVYEQASAAARVVGGWGVPSHRRGPGWTLVPCHGDGDGGPAPLRKQRGVYSCPS